MDPEVMHELDGLRQVQYEILLRLGYRAVRAARAGTVAWEVFRPQDDKRAMLYEDFSSEGQAIAAAIRRGSWG